ncbi:DUF6402 family protein [Luteibacter sp.]|jgi:hypothetical protein|uniref:DUF6402 family protein n=1 Tax=Luteibacter sp. TaxID=1886636 RepID=UPI002F3F8CC4
MTGNPQPKEHADTIKTVESIPGAMRQMGWTVSADLMDRWLGSPAWVLPHEMKKHQPHHRYTPENTDQRIVRMAWAMTHPRLKINVDELRKKMANALAKENLRERLLNSRWSAQREFAFGSRHDSAVDLEDTCQSNSLPFGEKLGLLDDMQGSLGVGSVKVALIGEATRDVRAGRLTLKVTHAGFYIRDTYDFSGFQFLGAWTTDRVLSATQMALNFPRRDMASRGTPVSATHVFNRDFENYRRVTGYGGDFVVYSDVLWESMNLSLEFTG